MLCAFLNTENFQLQVSAKSVSMATCSVYSGNAF